MKRETEGAAVRAALYARCSTHDKGQDPNLQLVPLREYCQRRGFTVTGEYIDNGVSGAKDRRPQLDHLMEAARKRQIDLILVWKLDRFGRSLRQLVVALEELSSLGMGFISFQDNLDLTTAQGRLMFHIIGAMAEFERELIRERVKAGLENARRKGKRLGRKPVPPIDRDKIIALREKDSSLSVRKIARKVGISAGFVGRTLKEHRMNKHSVLLENGI
ncbi:MAG: recombinase family protein [Thermodesulfovibrionales bacterium]